MKKMLLLLGFALETAQLTAQPAITSQPLNQAAVWGGNATFSVMATGVGPFTYQWQLNGTNLPNNIITTVAGGNLFNNQPATNTILNSAAGVAKDSAGNLFIADTQNHVIRKVDTNGLATIVAGNGSGSFSGDGGAATNASFYFPNAVIVDPAGNLFIADSGNNRIRKVDTNGVITTVAGHGPPSPVSDNGSATNAGINNPLGLCLDGTGNLFIADTGNNRIRKVATNGIITSFVASGLSNPSGVAVDSSNNLYIADTFNYLVRKVNPIGTITTAAGTTGVSGYSGDGGLATSAKLKNPVGVAVDAARNLYILDSGNHCVRKVGTNNIIVTLAGNGTAGYSGDGGMATNANLASPQNVAVDSIGNLFIADSGNNRVRQVTTNGTITTVAGRALNDGDFATNATLNLDHGTAFDLLGNFYVADAYNNRIRKIDTNGIITTVAGNGVPGFSGDGGTATNASLNRPISIALDVTGNLLIADTFNQRIRKVDKNGIISTVAGTGTAGFSGDGGAATNARFSTPWNVTVDISGNLWIADFFNNRIRKVGTNGVISTVAGTGLSGYTGDGGAATNARISSPYGVAVDAAGNFWIADANFNNRIRKVDTNGVITTVAGNGAYGYTGDGGIATNATLNTLYALTVDATGNLFIADSFNHCIRKVNTNGIISTIAGNGGWGFAGDGLPGKNANFSTPRGIAVDGTGNVYIADTGNNRIRKVSYVDFADQPSFTLTNLSPASLGNYSVVVTDSTGSVTSSVAVLTFALPPITLAIAASNGGYTFTWNATSNLTYQLQSATNLVAPVWIDFGGPITATSNFVSTNAVVGADGQRFYRVRLLP